MYSIKQVSVLAGIKPHTIRVWEKRYNVFSPKRTNTNIRRYSEEDLKLALNIKMLLSVGYRISRVAKMSNEEMADIVCKGNKYVGPPPVPESLLAAAISMDKDSFVAKVKGFIDEKGFEWTYENLMVPFQQRMGLLWQSGGVIPAQEHFTSNLLRDIIITYTSDLKPADHKREAVIFYLPEGEYHEIGLLYFNYIAKKEGYNITYLGQNVPLTNVVDMARKQNAHALLTSFTVSIPDETLVKQVNHLLESLPGVRLILTGHLIQQKLDLIPKNVSIVASALQFRELNL